MIKILPCTAKIAAVQRKARSDPKMPGQNRRGIVPFVLWVQGTYYALTGLWPLLSIETFQRVTGKKTDHRMTGREGDHWLVMTVGVLASAIAVSLLVAAWRRANTPETYALAIGSAAGLTTIDVVYVTRGTIAPAYLLDAAIEVFWPDITIGMAVYDDAVGMIDTVQTMRL